MAGAVIPDPRGGHVWIYGVDGSGNPVKVRVDADGHLQADVLSGGGDASAANQATMITALQKIDDLQRALDTIDTAYLIVGGA